MRRIPCKPRDDWAVRIESQGMHYHGDDEHEFWNESAHYRFSTREIDELECATRELYSMCIEAAGHVIERRMFSAFSIPPQFIELVVESWERDEFSPYGRFDLAYDGVHSPKLLEFNADTPTALLEASVIQWYWFKDVLPHLDQFNSIHERLIEAWRSQRELAGRMVHFSAAGDSLEDYMTVNYLRDTAEQAGLATNYLPMEDIGWDFQNRCFVDGQDRKIEHIFKLYPWEWMLADPFASNLLESTTRWLEAPWKMLLSNKAILAILWELYPKSPYLLEASFAPLGGPHVRKPLLSREGANIARFDGDQLVAITDGPYEGPHVYQRHVQLTRFDGKYPVIGSWVIDGEAAGIGIREDDSPVTRNTSVFVPHIFD